MHKHTHTQRVALNEQIVEEVEVLCTALAEHEVNEDKVSVNQAPELTSPIKTFGFQQWQTFNSRNSSDEEQCHSASYLRSQIKKIK